MVGRFSTPPPESWKHDDHTALDVAADCCWTESERMGIGEIDNLAGSTVLASGGLEHVTCPIGGNYDCMTWPQDLYKLKLQNVCFTARIMMCGYSCEGFIAEKANIQTLYVIGSTGLDSSAIKLYKCPSLF